jgi:hypothetical protein
LEFGGGQVGGGQVGGGQGGGTWARLGRWGRGRAGHHDVPNARHAALDLLFGHPADTHRLLPEIYERLTPQEVCAVARKVFAVEPTVSVILGEKV